MARKQAMTTALHWISEAGGPVTADDCGYWRTPDGRFRISPTFNHTVRPSGYRVNDTRVRDHQVYSTVREAKAWAERRWHRSPGADPLARTVAKLTELGFRFERGRTTSIIRFLGATAVSARLMGQGAPDAVRLEIDLPCGSDAQRDAMAATVAALLSAARNGG